MMEHVLIVLPVPLVAAIAASVWAAHRREWSNVSARALVLASLPSLIMFGSFYALALHMYTSLGRWPESIGKAGLSPALLLHAHMASWYFGGVLLAALFGLPACLLVCGLVARVRPYLPHLAGGGLAFVLCFVAMQLGPAGFLYWWWD